jgi:muramoyltetrapeptide carboxypeptidase LdcA involved in peptidoglycan recycling
MVMDADIGHTKTSLPVPLGVLATLDATRGSLTLSAPALA